MPGSQAELVVPLRRKGRVIGALNLLSDTAGQFTDVDEMMLRQFGAHVAVAIENALLFERARDYTSTLETLSDIAREFGSILNLDELLTRIASLTRRIIDYRTFGIFLLNDETEELEIKTAVRYGENQCQPRVKLGEGLVGQSALTKQAILVPDVSLDPRYIKVVEDARSELVIPLMVKDRCIGVFDLESPELNAFSKGISRSCGCSRARRPWRSRMPGSTRRSAQTKCGSRRKFVSRSACRRRCCPSSCRNGSRVWMWRHDLRRPASLGETCTTSWRRNRTRLVVAVGDVSGKGVPAALYSAFAGELVRSRTYRRRYAPDRFGPAGVLAAMNTILYERQLEEYYCTLCYALFDFKRRTVVMSNSGLPYPFRSTGACGPGAVADRHRAARRAPRVVSGIHVRRGHLRPAARGSVRLLHGRRLRGQRQPGA